MKVTHPSEAVHRGMPTLIVLMTALLTVATAAPHLTYTEANFQEPTRLVVKKPWRVEPVTIIAAKTKKKGDIDWGKPFVEDDDWLDGFTITVFNGSDKVVTAVAVFLTFPRPPGDTRNKFGQEINFGPSPISHYYTRRDPKKVIRPGETAELEVRPQTYESVKAVLRKLGYPESINRVELTVREVGFEDGSVLLSGTLYLQDPNHPSDPTKKIAAPKPASRNHHRRLTRKVIRISGSKNSLVARTLGLASA